MFANLKNNKLIFASIIAVFAIVGALYSIFMLSNYEKIYQDFYKSAKIDFQPQDLSHLKIIKFPLPMLVVDEITEQEKIELKNLQIRFSFWSILTMKPEIKNLKIQSAKIYLHNSDFRIVNHEQIIAELIQKNGINIDTDIAELTLIDPVSKDKIIIKNFSLDAEKQKRIFNGELQNIGKFSGSFENESDQINFKFNLSNPDYILNIDEVYKNFSFVEGKGDLKIQNIIHFINTNLAELHFILNDKLVLGPVDVTFNIQREKDLVKLSEIKFTANWLSGAGNLAINKNSSLPMNLNIKLDQINLAQTSSLQNTNNLNNFNGNKHLIIPANGIIAEILINQIILANGEKINEFKFISDTDKDNILIKDFSGKIASGGTFALDGKITSNSFRSLFDGKLILQHNNIDFLSQFIGFNNPSLPPIAFNLTTDLKCSLIDLYFNNIVLKTANAQVTGNIATKFIGSIPRLGGFLHFSNLDLNKFDYPIITSTYNYVKSLFQNTKEQDYLNKFIPIRTLSYLGNFDFTFNGLNIDQYKFDKVNLLLSIKDDQIAINNLYLNNGNDYLDLDLNLNVKNIKPKLDIKVNDGVFPLESVDPKGLLNLRNDIINNYSLEKINLSWDCYFSKIYQKNSYIEKIKFTGKNDNILLLISNLEADLLGGNFKGQGSILLDPYTINFAYAMNSLDLAKLSAALPKGMLNTEGGASFNGVFSTNGDSLEKQLYNLYSTSTMIAKDARLKNIAIDNIVENINSVDFNLQKFPENLKNSLLTGETNISSAKADLELTNGNVKIKNLEFQTNYTLGTASGVFDIYNFSINLSSVLSFYVTEKSFGGGYNSNNRVTAKMGIDFTGSIFGPKKVADTAALLQILQVKNNRQN